MPSDKAMASARVQTNLAWTCAQCMHKSARNGLALLLAGLIQCDVESYLRHRQAMQEVEVACAVWLERAVDAISLSVVAALQYIDPRHSSMASSSAALLLHSDA